MDVFNIVDFLPSKDTENKCNALLELNNNIVSAWKKGTTFIVGDSMLSAIIDKILWELWKVWLKILPLLLKDVANP